MINFYAGLTQTDNTSYPNADKTRQVNMWYRLVMGWIWKAQGDWIFDDSNFTDLPYFRTNCQNGQDDYTLPANYGVVERIEYKDANGIWKKLIPKTKSEILAMGIEEFQKTDGIPVYVELFANSYRLYPAANRTSTDGDSIRVYCTRDASLTGTTTGTNGPFTASDTTKEPGFNRNWHHVLALGPAKDFCLREGKRDVLARADRLQIEIDKIQVAIEQYYGNRGNLAQERIRPRKRQHHAR